MILMHEDKMIAGLVPEEGGGGGHVIQDASGTEVAQEPTMQFADSHVSDDSQNDKTVIENIKPLTGAEFDVVTEDGFYAITDEDDATMEDTSADYVEVTADGVKTYATLFNELFALVDLSKVNENTTLQFLSGVHYVQAVNAAEIYLTQCIYVSGKMQIATAYLRTSASNYKYSTYNGTTFTPTDASSQIPTNGTIITLYYGTDSCVTNLINQAKYTYMESGQTVQEKIASIDLGSFLDLSSLETAIKNKLATMKKGDILTGVFSTTQSFAPFNITGGQSIIIQSRADNNSTIGMIQVWNQLGYMHYGFCSNGTFTWKKPTLT